MGKFDAMVEKYGGREVSREGLSGYKKWALDFFHRKEFITEPHLGLTLQTDISEHETFYCQQRSNTNNGSFTAFLTYKAFHAVRKHRELNFRFLDGKWYEFASIPLYVPVAVPEPERFRSALLENVETLSLQSFFDVYTAQIKTVQDLPWERNEIDPFLFEISLFIGNLPKLQFTSLAPHQRSLKTGAPLIYFGKRYRQDGKLLVPLFFGGDHSTFDPVILGHVLDEFSILNF